MNHHAILAPLHVGPALLCYWAGHLGIIPASPLLVLAAVCIASAYARGWALERRNDELEGAAPTPLPRTRGALPPLTPPPLREVPPEVTGTRVRRSLVEWPGGRRESVRSVPPASDGEVTETATGDR